MSDELYERFLEIQEEEIVMVPNNSLKEIIYLKVISHDTAEEDVTLFNQTEGINTQ